MTSSSARRGRRNRCPPIPCVALAAPLPGFFPLRGGISQPLLGGTGQQHGIVAVAATPSHLLEVCALARQGSGPANRFPAPLSCSDRGDEHGLRSGAPKRRWPAATASSAPGPVAGPRACVGLEAEPNAGRLASTRLLPCVLPIAAQARPVVGFRGGLLQRLREGSSPREVPSADRDLPLQFGRRHGAGQAGAPGG